MSCEEFVYRLQYSVDFVHQIIYKSHRIECANFIAGRMYSWVLHAS